MERVEQVYRDLQQHLDGQAIGYPASRSGADIRLLKRFFSPEEAQLAMHLTYRPATVQRIYDLAKGSGTSFTAVESMLDGMAVNGVIGRTEKEGIRYFYTLPLVVGMYEGQVKKLSPEFLEDFDAYTRERSFGLALLSTELPQMRTIPVEASLSFEQHVTTYDHLAEIINGTEGPYAVLECICRKSARIKGHPCKKTARTETCMALGDMARIVSESESGRAIDREEALEIARMNQADGLVLQPSNTRKVDFVCACCGCCCGMLRIQKALPKPVEFWATNYYAAADAEVCSGCGTCVERCQVDAVSMDDHRDVSVVNRDRCIGCGNCVTTCPSGAMRLVRKDEEVVPPEDLEDLYDTIMAKKKGKLGKVKLATRIVLKQ
jgi:Na+-translocating ferredoxin:NAD+ oxidoreductase subunit B